MGCPALLISDDGGDIFAKPPCTRSRRAACSSDIAVVRLKFIETCTLIWNFVKDWHVPPKIDSFNRGAILHYLVLPGYMPLTHATQKGENISLMLVSSRSPASSASQNRHFTMSIAIESMPEDSASMNWV